MHVRQNDDSTKAVYVANQSLVGISGRNRGQRRRVNTYDKTINIELRRSYRLLRSIEFLSIHYLPRFRRLHRPEHPLPLLARVAHRVQ